MEQDYKEIRIVLPIKVHTKLKDKAKNERRTIKSVMHELIDSYITDKWGSLLREDLVAVDRLISKIKKLEGE